MKSKILFIILLFGVEAVLSYPGSRTEHVFVKCKNARDTMKKLIAQRKYEKAVHGPDKPKNKTNISKLDLRIGQIVATKVHPADGTLYVSKIDIGNGTIKVTDYTEMWKTHNKCRNATYANNNMTIHRLTVPDGYIHWNVTWLEYTPPMYTADFVYQALWSDPDLNKTDFRPLWNDIDGPLNRKSYVKIYDVNNLYPINPVGRTGLRGRGFLGRWGPNHVTDSVVTRWKRNNTKLVYHELTNKPILQFIAIQKKHIKEWYLPGGFVNPGEDILTSLKREFLEETMNILKKKSTEAEKLNKQIQEFFINGKEVYKGYIDDARNTDNAWVEMTAVHFHDKTGEFVNKFVLEAGDDACNVAWLDINKSISLPKATYYIIHSISVEYDSHW